MALEYTKKASSKKYTEFFKVKDPVSALTHFIGFILSVLFTPVLLCRVSINTQSIIKLLGYSVYCISMSVLYGASTSYHTFILPERKEMILKKIDHISIFFLIAGTYTPICLTVLDRSTGAQLLIAVWSVALLGTVMKVFWVTCPKFVSSIVYILMGWIAVIKIVPIFKALSTLQFILLITGGIIYTIGGIIYALKFSINEHWSEHELFHLFILAGSIFHYILLFICV